MFDTNGLVKYYHPEVGSQKVQHIIDNSSNRIFISDLSIIELVSSLAKKARMGDITIPAFRIARRKFFSDLKHGKFFMIMLTQKHGNDAIKFLVKYSTKRALRTLDALQLAIAIDLKKQKNLDTFVSSDDKLTKVVKLEKIVFLNPELP